MSYIENKEGYVFNAGYFLAHEECERKSYTIPASMGIDAGGGAKFVPSGTPYPSNDGNAIGLVYEDTDVSNGDVAGSVVIKGTAYNDRLPVTGAVYNSATVTSADNPTTEGWYEKGEGETYSSSSDTVAKKTKEYYTRSGSSPNYTYTKVSEVEYGDNPKLLGLYERSGESPDYIYTLSTDTQADGAKTYYEITEYERVSSTARAVLTSIKFIDED